MTFVGTSSLFGFRVLSSRISSDTFHTDRRVINCRDIELYVGGIQPFPRFCLAFLSHSPLWLIYVLCGGRSWKRKSRVLWLCLQLYIPGFPSSRLSF